jgi:hypothetical protein
LTGAAFTTWLSVPAEHFDLLSGDQLLMPYQATENVIRHFCRHCGTHVFSRDRRNPEILGLPLGIVAEPHGITPNGDYFSSDKAQWAHLFPGIPHFGGPSGFEPIPSQAICMDPQESVQKLLVEMESSLLRSNIRQSDVVSMLLSEDFIEFGSSGQVFAKPDIIAALQSEPAIQFTASEFHVRLVASDVAMVTYRVIRHIDPPVSTLRSSMWVQKEGHWQMIFHQGTLVPHLLWAC